MSQKIYQCVDKLVHMYILYFYDLICLWYLTLYFTMLIKLSLYHKICISKEPIKSPGDWGVILWSPRALSSTSVRHNNLCHTESILKNIMIYLWKMFAWFLNTEDGTSTWNPSLKETRTCWFYIRNACWILASQTMKVPDIEYLNTKILEESYQSFCCKSNTTWNLQITFHKSTKYSAICYEMNFHFNCWCWIVFNAMVADELVMEELYSV